MFILRSGFHAGVLSAEALLLGHHKVLPTNCRSHTIMQRGLSLLGRNDTSYDLDADTKTEEGGSR